MPPRPNISDGSEVVREIRERWDALQVSTRAASGPEDAAADPPPSARDVDPRLLATFLGIEYVADPTVLSPSAEFVERIPIAFARQHLIYGLAGEGDFSLRVVISSLAAWPVLDVLARYLGRRIEPQLGPPEGIRAAINGAYQQRTGQTQKILRSFDGGDILLEIKRLSPREDLLDVADRPPVIRLVNTLLFDAVTGMASDVHIQPREESLVVRLRIDGILFDAFEIPKHLQEEVISRIKVVGGMNIAEKRLPQDGRATVEVGDRLIDLRIASMPTSHGERVVIRLLDKSARMYTLGEIGMDRDLLERFRGLIHLEHGLILVTGPTGSGKSTTLYAALRDLNTQERNVVTLEDPIEYQLDGISQTQINTKKGMTFASGLRSILRQDPDIIMVGEIRDHETAVMAIQSALTGHLVFSTLHTNDAASAVTRLLDLGIEPYLAASSVVGVLAQRLVRRICPHCTVACEPPEEDLRAFGFTGASRGPVAFARGTGCARCRQTGYSGRFGIFELLVMDEAIRSCVQARRNAAEIGEVALRAGTRTMGDYGLAKVMEGKTTLDEVARVTIRATL